MYTLTCIQIQTLQTHLFIQKQPCGEAHSSTLVAHMHAAQMGSLFTSAVTVRWGNEFVLNICTHIMQHQCADLHRAFMAI